MAAFVLNLSLGRRGCPPAALAPGHASAPSAGEAAPGRACRSAIVFERKSLGQSDRLALLVQILH